MEDNNDIVRVIFRTFKDNEVIALFPDISFNYCLISSYMHQGQHGGADYNHVIKKTRPATEEEKNSLLKELKNIGYKNLRVIKKNYKI